MLGHIFNTKTIASLLNYTKTTKGNKEEIINAISDIPSIKGMEHVNMRFYIQNDNPNDKRCYEDNYYCSYHATTQTDFEFIIDTMFKKLLNKIFDNTTGLNTMDISVTFNCNVYETNNVNCQKKGNIKCMLNILSPTNHDTFKIERKYNINLEFEKAMLI